MHRREPRSNNDTPRSCDEKEESYLSTDSNIAPARNQVSEQTVNHLIESLINAFQNINNPDLNISKLILNIINSLKYLPFQEKSFRIDLKNVDIFTPILKTDNNDEFIFDENYNYKLDLFSILFAYCSIHKSLHEFIIDSWDNWYHLLLNSQSTIVSDNEELGFYTVINKIEQFECLTPDLLNYFNFNLINPLINSWIPKWKSFIDLGDSPSTTLSSLSSSPTLLSSPYPNNKNSNIYSDSRLLTTVLNVTSIDFFIATSIITLKYDVFNLNTTKDGEQQQTYNPFIVYELSKRISMFPKLIPNTIYLNALDLIISKGVTPSTISSVRKNEVIENSHEQGIKNHKDDLTFHLKVIMEFIDHPELNYLKEPRLVLLLQIALQNISNHIPIHILHKTLSSMGSTQTLIAIFNMAQFLLAKFLIDLENCSQYSDTNSISNSKSNVMSNTDIIVPPWFDEVMIPPIPPISKSLFIFEAKLDDDDIDPLFQLSGNNSFKNIISSLLESLNLIIIINKNILSQYKALSINPLDLQNNYANKAETADAKNTKNNKDNVYISNNDRNKVDPSIRLLTNEKYMEICFIPIISCFLLSDLLKNNQRKNTSLGLSLIANTTKALEALIELHGNMSLFHLIKFIEKISMEDLSLQKVSINLLNHLFFHNASNPDYIKQLCLQNELTTQALNKYISSWNDGSEDYKNFFEILFDTKQPTFDNENVRPTLSSIIDLVKQLPDFADKFGSLDLSVSSKATVANNSMLRTNINVNKNNKNTIEQASPIQPVPNRLGVSKPFISSTTSSSSTKYDAYTTSSFIPSNKSFPSPMVSSANSTTNKYMYSAGATGIDNHGGHMTMTMTSAPVPVDTFSSQRMDMHNAVPHRNNLSDEIMNNSISNMPKTPTSMASNNTSTTSSNINTTATTNNSNNKNSTLWNESPGFSSSKMVNTGKNYILGGHNRVRNNSRAQSIHIDEFEQQQY
ncbi:Vir1p NDAI_0D03790 [Naumovozyma dairenensis CBS 421]|uniref:Uncharacterized protein n=1 Tax=Naumovozyma dairenensis (strain ATCC 10597 / BCRC 20456 / CBS 421 / NBRC 0211 / NRRL Y-12639) TaxID=1071378 RepID=G0WA82_NAUDC|nr:hypothetical protein NDAI_0D03790 [Naumovozyma dairenensis CBS 421]CCD24693.1 hypothetical protein NDAI_0D03790 [Naumovozyma dairenensis CBS 421]